MRRRSDIPLATPGSKSTWMVSCATRLHVTTLAMVLTVLAVLLPDALAAPAPRIVSPGSASAAEPLAVSCPTFSWAEVADATGYELVLYRLSESGTLETVLQTQLPGGASSWTPSAASCPTSGSEYAWAVRSIADEGGPGSWSELMLFTTPAKPTDDEVRQALDVLRRHQGSAAERPDSGRDAPGALNVPLANNSEGNQVQIEAAKPVSDALTSPTIGEKPSPQAITAPASFSLSLDGDVDLGGAVFRGTSPFIHNRGLTGDTGLGLFALSNLTSGVYNTAVGHNALKANDAGSRNTAVGTGALFSNKGGSWNTAVGAGALVSNTTGQFNMAGGQWALASNTTGQRNTAAGARAMFNNTSGYFNSALGFKAMYENTSGSKNVAIGDRAMENNTNGYANTAIGYTAMFNNSVGGNANTAVGHKALFLNTTGAVNTAVGYRAGQSWTTGSFNIAVGNGAFGVPGESNTIRIGGNDNQSKTFIEGIFGATVTGGAQVLINSSNQLGTSTSSARFKQDIRDLGAVRDRLMDLRPVSFRYKDEFAAGGSNPLEYGLIAEEVAEVFPELVVRDAEGKPYTVRYHLLTPLLLAEVQRLHSDLERQIMLVGSQRREIDSLRRRVSKISKRDTDH